jgi:hypothetical protein
MENAALDASLPPKWFLEDEVGRQYSVSVLAGFSSPNTAIPILWFDEMGTIFSFPIAASGSPSTN